MALYRLAVGLLVACSIAACSTPVGDSRTDQGPIHSRTTGTTRPSASIAAERSEVNDTDAPARSSARTAERVLPEP